MYETGLVQRTINELEGCGYLIPIKYPKNRDMAKIGYVKLVVVLPKDFSGTTQRVPFYVPNWHAVNGHIRASKVYELIKDLYPLHDKTRVMFPALFERADNGQA